MVAIGRLYSVACVIVVVWKLVQLKSLHLVPGERLVSGDNKNDFYVRFPEKSYASMSEPGVLVPNHDGSTQSRDFMYGFNDRPDNGYEGNFLDNQLSYQKLVGAVEDKVRDLDKSLESKLVDSYQKKNLDSSQADNKDNEVTEAEKLLTKLSERPDKSYALDARYQAIAKIEQIARQNLEDIAKLKEGNLAEKAKLANETNQEPMKDLENLDLEGSNNNEANRTFANETIKDIYKMPYKAKSKDDGKSPLKDHPNILSVDDTDKDAYKSSDDSSRYIHDDGSNDTSKDPSNVTNILNDGSLDLTKDVYATEAHNSSQNKSKAQMGSFTGKEDNKHLSAEEGVKELKETRYESKDDGFAPQAVESKPEITPSAIASNMPTETGKPPTFPTPAINASVGKEASKESPTGSKETPIEGKNTPAVEAKEGGMENKADQSAEQKKKKKIKILILDDDDDIAESLNHYGLHHSSHYVPNQPDPLVILPHNNQDHFQRPFADSMHPSYLGALTSAMGQPMHGGVITPVTNTPCINQAYAGQHIFDQGPSVHMFNCGGSHQAPMLNKPYRDGKDITFQELQGSFKDPVTYPVFPPRFPVASYRPTPLFEETGKYKQQIDGADHLRPEIHYHLHISKENLGNLENKAMKDATLERRLDELSEASPTNLERAHVITPVLSSFLPVLKPFDMLERTSANRRVLNPRPLFDPAFLPGSRSKITRNAIKRNSVRARTLERNVTRNIRKHLKSKQKNIRKHNLWKSTRKSYPFFESTRKSNR